MLYNHYSLRKTPICYEIENAAIHFFSFNQNSILRFVNTLSLKTGRVVDHVSFCTGVVQDVSLTNNTTSIPLQRKYKKLNKVYCHFKSYISEPVPCLP
jgi:hypothetical protein